MNYDVNWLVLAVLAVLFLCCHRGYRRGFVREMIATFFTIASLLMVWVVNPYVNQYLREETPIYANIQEKCRDMLREQAEKGGGLDGAGQGQLIESLPLPGMVKSGLAQNNTTEVYQFLAVDSFADYIANYLAKIICNGVGFVISYFLSTALIRIVIYALDVISRLPVLKGLNKFAGIFLGGVRGILYVWVGFLVITIFCNAGWGRLCIRMIEDSPFLNYLYEKDLLVDVFMSIFY